MPGLLFRPFYADAYSPDARQFFVPHQVGDAKPVVAILPEPDAGAEFQPAVDPSPAGFPVPFPVVHEAVFHRVAGGNARRCGSGYREDDVVVRVIVRIAQGEQNRAIREGVFYRQCYRNDTVFVPRCLWNIYLLFHHAVVFARNAKERYHSGEDTTFEYYFHDGWMTFCRMVYSGVAGSVCGGFFSFCQNG